MPGSRPRSPRWSPRPALTPTWCRRCSRPRAPRRRSARSAARSAPSGEVIPKRRLSEIFIQNGRRVSLSSPSRRARADVHALALRAEQAQDLDRRVLRPRGAEPVRHPRVELGRLAGGQDQVVLAEHDPEPAVQHVQPLVTLVGPRFGHVALARRDHQLVCLQPARTAGQRVHGHPVPLHRPRMHPRVGDRRRDELIQRDLVGTGDGEQQLQRRPALARLQPGQRADRDVRRRGQLSQAGAAFPAQRPQPRPDGGERLVCFGSHLSILPYWQSELPFTASMAHHGRANTHEERRDDRARGRAI